MPSWRRDKSGHMKSRNSIIHENCEGSISLTRRIRNSKRPSRMPVRSWKRQWLPLCPVKLWKIVGVVYPTKFKQNLRVFWKLEKQQGGVWENRYRTITKTILQEKVNIHDSTVTWFTNLFLCLKLWKFLQRKQRWTRNGKNWRKFRRGTWQKSEVRKRWSMKQRRRALQFIFASLMDICHLKNTELEAKHQKYKGRVVLCADIVKDDSGSYAVFTEQGSSASQMTAAKIMDIISRLPGCDGQAADVVSAYTQVKMEDAPKLLKIPKSECPDIRIRLPRHKWPKSWSSMEDPVVPLERNLYGHPSAGLLWERPFEKVLLKHGWEKIPNWECLFVHSEKGLFLSVFVDDIKLAGKKQNIDPMWKVLNKEVDLGEPTSFLDHVYLGCTQRQCEISKDIVDNYRTMFESRISAGGIREITTPSKYSYFFVVLWHGRSCKEVCGTILWVGEQDDSATLQSIYSMHRWPPLQRRRNKICWRTVKYMLSNCSEMLILGKDWTTWYVMVSK